MTNAELNTLLPRCRQGPIIDDAYAQPQAEHGEFGPPVDPTPAPRPGRGHAERPLRNASCGSTAARHGPDLWEAVRGHDQIWTYMSYGPVCRRRPPLRTGSRAREASPDPFYYAILDAAGRAVGLTTLVNIQPAMRTIEVGHILYSPALQRTPLATEAQYLLARYVFETLGYRRYEWKCNALNRPSYRAALRFGFTFEGVFRQHMIVKGHSRDTAWFSMLDTEWPARKAAFERWLAPENFDDAGAPANESGRSQSIYVGWASSRHQRMRGRALARPITFRHEMMGFASAQPILRGIMPWPDGCRTRSRSSPRRGRASGGRSRRRSSLKARS